MPMVNMTMIWNLPWIKPVVLCTSTQSERPSSKTPIIEYMKLKVSFMETC